VRAVYLACPADHEVDHRIPLALGGLHCCHNLQILTKAAHREKTKVDIAQIRGAA
jgi:5-methylcytosine-specific restriction endonuclease McrA